MEHKREYRNEIDRLCAEAARFRRNETPEPTEPQTSPEAAEPQASPEKAAQPAPSEQIAAAQPQEKGKKRAGWIAAGCVGAAGLLAAAAGFMGYGPLALLSLPRSTIRDASSTEPINQANPGATDQTNHDTFSPADANIYRLEQITVNVDSGSPKLTFDLLIDDPEIAAANETVTLGVNILDIEPHMNRPGSFGRRIANAQRDAGRANLYHADVECEAAWLPYGEEFLVDIAGIWRLDEKGERGFDEIGMPIRMQLPDHVIGASELSTIDFNTDLCFSEGSINYHVCHARISDEETAFVMWFETEQTGDLKLEHSPVLTVDDIRYVCDESDCNVWRDRIGGFGYPDRCYVFSVFPAVDPDAAEKIELHLGAESIALEEYFSDEPVQMSEDWTPLAQSYFDDTDIPVILHAGGTEYRLMFISYYQHYTIMSFEADADKINSVELCDQLVLNANWKEHRVNGFFESDQCLEVYDTAGVPGDHNIGCVYVILDAIDFQSMMELTLERGEESFSLWDEYCYPVAKPARDSGTAYFSEYYNSETNPDLILNDGKIEYRLESLACYSNHTDLMFTVEAESIEDGFEDGLLRSGLVLNADGTELRCKEITTDDYVYDFDDRHWVIFCEMPAIDYLAANDLTVSLGDTSICLKSPHRVLHRPNGAE